MKEKIFINARIIDPSQKMDEKGSLILVYKNLNRLHYLLGNLC